MRAEDPALRAAFFLHRHPGWTLRNLEDADDDVVELMRAIDRAEADAEQRRARQQGG